NDLTAGFPEVARAVRALPVPRAVLDGELVVPDAGGRPSFQALQKRARLGRALDVRRAAARSPAVYFVLELVEVDGRHLAGVGAGCRGAAQLSGAPEAGPPGPGARRAARRGPIAGGVLRVRSAGVRRPRLARVRARRAEEAPGHAAAAAGADPVSGAFRPGR